jgi:L-asparaginase
MSKFRLKLIYTGGTIGCVGDPLTPLGADRFEAAFKTFLLPIIQERYPDIELGFEAFCPSLDSTNLRPSDWARIATTVIGRPGDTTTYGDADGFLVLHGTDTMAWSAAALSFLLTGLDRRGQVNAQISKPVILTGSQSPLFFENPQTGELTLRYNTDAIRNVLGAFECIRAGIAQVGLFFNDDLMRGNRALKTNATEFDAFTSPNYPVVAEMGIELTVRNRLLIAPPINPQISIDTPETLTQLQAQLAHLTDALDQVTMVDFLAYPASYSASQSSSTLADALQGALEGVGGADGLYLENYGEGNFPSGNPDDPQAGAVFKVLKAAHARGTVIASGTQVISGMVNSTAYASGAWLAECGCVSTYDMSGPAVQTKLTYLLALAQADYFDWPQETVENLMRTPIAGEMTPINRLDDARGRFLVAGQSIAAFDGSATLENDPDRGPVLIDPRSPDRPLWAALDTAATAHPAMPGRLLVQGDGDLVFYDRSNGVLWQSGTSSSRNGSAVLILSGSLKRDDLALYVFDESTHRVLKTLYGKAPDIAALG